jgi:hypothetical protein
VLIILQKYLVEDSIVYFTTKVYVRRKMEMGTSEEEEERKMRIRWE